MSRVESPTVWNSLTTLFEYLNVVNSSKDTTEKPTKYAYNLILEAVFSVKFA